VTDAAVTNAPATPTKATLGDAEAVLTAMNSKRDGKDDGRRAKAATTMIDRRWARWSRPARNAKPWWIFRKSDRGNDVGDELLRMKGDVAKIYSETFSKEQLTASRVSSFTRRPGLHRQQPNRGEDERDHDAQDHGRDAEGAADGEGLAMEMKAKRDAGGAAAPATAPKDKFATPSTPRRLRTAARCRAAMVDSAG